MEIRNTMREKNSWQRKNLTVKQNISEKGKEQIHELGVEGGFSLKKEECVRKPANQ